MKIVSKSVLFAVLATVILTACGGGGSSGANGQGSPMQVDGSNFDSTALGGTLAALPLETLSAAEQITLTYMREEEKLAHDVYAKLDVLYAGNTRVFGNIAISEATHTEAVRQLLVRYNLPDPAANLGAGLYMNPILQGLHAQLVNAGSVSLIDALKVGATIEEIDMIDINVALPNVDNQDIRLVYDNLLKGSRNHLRSFVKTLSTQGVTYVPQYMTLGDFNTIIGTPMER